MTVKWQVTQDKWDETMDWKIGFYQWYFTNILDIRRHQTKFNTNYRTGGISTKKSVKSTIYRFGTNKSTKKSSVKRCAEQRRKLVKISEIYRWYIDEYIGYIGNISGKYQRFFLKFFFKYIFILFYFLMIHF